MKSKLGLILFLVVVVLAALLVAQTRHSRVQQAEMEALRKQVAIRPFSTREDRPAPRDQPGSEALPPSAVTEKPPLDPLDNPSPAVSAPRASAPTVEASQPPAGGMAGMIGNMMKDPEMRKALAQQQKVGLSMAYGSLFKQLKLTPDQEEKFKDILLDQQMSNMSQAGALLSAGDNRAELVAKLGEEQKERETKLKETLGEEKFAQYQDYNQTLSERMMLEQFGKQIEATPEQHEQLLTIMREEKQNAQINLGGDTQTQKADNIQAVLGSPEAAEKMITQQEVANARVLERASQVLTPEQLGKLEPVLKNQVEMQRAGMKMARQMFGGGQPPAEPGK